MDKKFRDIEIRGSIEQVRWANGIRYGFKKRLEESKRQINKNDRVVLGCTDPNLLIDNRDLINNEDSKAFVETIGAKWIGPTKYEDYKVCLLEKYRSPSKGGNAKAIHSHKMLIDGFWYYFKALGWLQWVYKEDTVEFAWYGDGERRLIFEGTIYTIDKHGIVVYRGNPQAKRKQRTAEQRMPVSRREFNSD